MLQSELKYNTAYPDGGGLAAAYNVKVYIQDCLIYGNVGGVRGGGIHFLNLHQKAVVTNTKIYSNVAAYDGGGIFARSSGTKVYLQDSFFVNNSANEGRGEQYTFKILLHCTLLILIFMEIT